MSPDLTNKASSNQNGKSHSPNKTITPRSCLRHLMSVLKVALSSISFGPMHRWPSSQPATSPFDCHFHVERSCVSAFLSYCQLETTSTIPSWLLNCVVPYLKLRKWSTDVLSGTKSFSEALPTARRRHRRDWTSEFRCGPAFLFPRRHVEDQRLETNNACVLSLIRQKTRDQPKQVTSFSVRREKEMFKRQDQA